MAKDSATAKVPLADSISQLKIQSSAKISDPAGKEIYRLTSHAQAEELKDKTVELRGWADAVRSQKGFSFVDVRIGQAIFQCVFKVVESDAALAFKEITEECTLAIIGTLKATKTGQTAPGGIEISVVSYKVLSKSPAGGLEGVVQKNSQQSQILNTRHLSMRMPQFSVWIRMKHIVLQAYRDFCENVCGQVEIVPPTLIEFKGEGGSEVFEVDYFGKKVFLTQTSQLALEVGVPALGDCFCIMPSYRAEKSSTVRHLTEYTHAEAELSFITLDELMDHVEAMIRHMDKKIKDSGIMKEVFAHCTKPNPYVIEDKPFLRIKHSDYIKELKAMGITKEDGTFFKEGEDVPSGPERKYIDAKKPTSIPNTLPSSHQSFLHGKRSRRF